jgi:hypothetical protein
VQAFVNSNNLLCGSSSLPTVPLSAARASSKQLLRPERMEGVTLHHPIQSIVQVYCAPMVIENKPLCV